MNSIVKINDYASADLMIVRAIAYHESDKVAAVYFMRHENPLLVVCEYDDYLNLYTKWRNYAEWRLQLMMGDDSNG